MNPIISYLLKSALSLALLYIFYWSFLRKETFFRFNRYYFLGSIALSLLIPIIDIGSLFIIRESIPVRTISESYISFQNAVVSPLVIAQPEIVDKRSITDYVLIIYFIGAAFILLRMLTQAITLLVRSRKTNTLKIAGLKVITHKKIQSPFSFFSFVFINPEQLDAENIREVILHEKEHIQQKHSFDLLIIELLTVLQWPNPFVWLTKKSLKETHEFLADHAVLEQGVPVVEYQKTLISFMLGAGNPALITPLNFSLNKKRIIMMNKMKSPNIRKWRSLLLLPLIVTLTLAFSSPLTTNKKTNSSQTIQHATDISEIQAEEKNMITGKVIDSETNKPIPGTSIIIYGTFTGTISDIDGKFRIASTYEKAQIAFSYVGYETVIVTLKSGDNPVIKLKKVVTEISFDDVTPTEPRQPDHLTADDNMVFFIVEDMPKFPGGIPAISKYISSNIVYPEEAKKQKIEGTVIVKFTVDKNGKVTDVQIKEGKTVNPLLDKEAIRVVSEMPDWKPAEQRGKKVPVSMSVSVTFKLK